jgi:hypothetical protein
LLDENWTGERILDARGYQVMQAINEKLGPSTIVILPTIFYSQLTIAFRARKYSAALKELHGALLTDLPRFLAFVFNKDLTHWAPCVVSVEDRIVRQGDSLTRDPDTNMLAMMRWLLGDISQEYGEWKETMLAVPQQGASSGSCGIVAMSAIERYVGKTAVPWSTHLSAQFRHRWLVEFVQHHLKAISPSNKVRIRVCSCERALIQPPLAGSNRGCYCHFI